MKPHRPSKQDLLAAQGKTVPDVIAPDLEVLFVGINPSLYSAAVRHHFARPGNRFWPVLHRAGFTNRLLSPFEERQLLQRGYGITNVVARATASAAELSAAELMTGARRLTAKVRRYRPCMVAVLGIGAYRAAFDRRKATLGKQQEALADAMLWVLPNPSGLNANYQLNDLARLFRKLRTAAERED
ncbi:MAG: G/U mismatch-specific DNA glycosylase [Acidiferrobacterales bacterium]